MSQKHVYICGAKGISQYGGFESFVKNLLKYSTEYTNIKFHIACKANGQGAMDVKQLIGASEIKDNHFTYCGADCFLIPVSEALGSAQAISYDLASIKAVCNHIKKNKISNPVIYILTCRIGPFIKKYVDYIHKHGGKVFLNPDGNEWARRKWSRMVRRYWKLSERMMVKYADHIICDNRHIETYIQDTYSKYNPVTSFIPYGSDIRPSELSDDDYRLKNWLELVGVQKGQYFLVVGRFVEENNFDIIIREFMNSNTSKKLVLLTTFNKKLKLKFKKKLDYKKDSRIVLAEPVYDEELLKKIRENAFAYIHGHEVGGTNPSLLEGLSSTNLNLVYEARFNKEVAGDTAIYWSKSEGDLSKLINKVDLSKTEDFIQLGINARERVAGVYDWVRISEIYNNLFY